MERRIIIVNPVAGNGKAIDEYNKTISRFKDRNLDFETFYTNGKNDAFNISKNESDENDIIYAIGGDGTISEVAKGIINTNKRLCVIPGGSGNDFYRTIKNIEPGEEVPIDIGTVNNDYFINSFSIGIDSDICDNANNYKSKLIPVSLKYYFSIAETLFKYKPKRINLYNENTIITLLTVSNGKYYGGGFKINPHAILNDGYLDLTYVDATSKSGLIDLMIKLIKEKHYGDPRVHDSMVRKLQIFGDNMKACVDGEVVRSNEFKVGILDKAVKIYNDPCLCKGKMLVKN